MGRESGRMTKRIVARWQGWSDKSLEHLVVQEDPEEIVAEAAVLATSDGHNFAANYWILCDSSWRVTKARISQIGDDRTVELVSDGVGNWTDGSASPLPHLAGAIDIDISVTPFTNTLPIRRLRLETGQAENILAVYIQLPGLTVTTDRQRYTCLAPRLYRYESVDSEFTRDIEIDDHGLVMTYPGLFRRVL
jgi:uncharacterized protein